MFANDASSILKRCALLYWTSNAVVLGSYARQGWPGGHAGREDRGRLSLQALSTMSQSISENPPLANNCRRPQTLVKRTSKWHEVGKPNEAHFSQVCRRLVIWTVWHHIQTGPSCIQGVAMQTEVQRHSTIFFFNDTIFDPWQLKYTHPSGHTYSERQS